MDGNINFDDFIWFPAPECAIVRTPLHFTCPAGEGNVEMNAVIPKGCLMQYWKSEEDGDMIEAALDYITLRMPEEEFRKVFHTLPMPPAGLRYCSLDEALDEAPIELWIYDFNANTFIHTKALIEQSGSHRKVSLMLEQNFTEENYGERWIALITAK